MGIVIKNALTVLPDGDQDQIKETSLYIEGETIQAIGTEPNGFYQITIQILSLLVPLKRWPYI